MASKNLRKLRQWGFSGFGFSDDFDPNQYPTNWVKFEKYVASKESTMIYQSLVLSLYKQEIEAYIKGGHKLSRNFRKEIKANAKAKAKEITKARLQTSSNPAQQSYKEQETVLAEG